MPMLIGMMRMGVRRAALPLANLEETLLVQDMDILPIGHLRELTAYVSGKQEIAARRSDGAVSAEDTGKMPDFSDIKEHAAVKRAAR